MKNSISILPYQYYFLPVVLLSLMGLADTSYLVLSHYRNYTDIGYASFCAISKAINCDTVSQSSWSILFGIPVALWGFTGYLLYIFILIPAHKNIPERLSLWSILQILGLFFSLAAVVFGYISAKKIHSYCLLCILSYGISFLLFFYPWLIRRRFDRQSLLTSTGKAILIVKKSAFLKISILSLVFLIIGLKVLLPHYWIYEYPSSSANSATGHTEDGNPWIGARHPKITIEEFTDYQCFQCGKLHYFLRRLVEQHPDTVRLVHHHYPLDHEYNPILVPEPFHVGSGGMALLAIYASSKGKFWEMNDELYALVRKGDRNDIDMTAMAKKLVLPVEELQAVFISLLFRQELARDIRRGIQAGITGTPAYIINGKTFIGEIPASVFQDLKL